ncbi:MAG: alpha-L-fucosidase [Thermoguttaceae bacterium]
MKYMLFATKHHDGFSMFGTKQTECAFSVTAGPSRAYTLVSRKEQNGPIPPFVSRPVFSAKRGEP